MEERVEEIPKSIGWNPYLDVPSASALPPDDDSTDMNEEVKSRVNSSVPNPEAVKRLSENEKRSLEIEGEIEHTDGQQREDLAEQAEEIVTGTDPHSATK